MCIATVVAKHFLIRLLSSRDPINIFILHEPPDYVMVVGEGPHVP